MASSGMLRHVALVRTDVSEELSASIIRVTRICELGTTLAVASNRRQYSDWLQAEGAAVVQSVERLATSCGSHDIAVGIATGYRLWEPR
jgi:hypothetical protein